MKIRCFSFLLILFFCVYSVHSQVNKSNIFVKNQMEAISKQYKTMVKNLASTTKPPRTLSNGVVKCVSGSDWTSGFFAGGLWYLYEYTGDADILTSAKYWTKVLASQQYNTGTHDLGFMLYCSYGNGLRLTSTKSYSDVLKQGAKSLSSRYNPNVGCIRSWDRYSFPVIIDNMMNLEFLFWATKVTGDSTYYTICINHADTTLKNQFRDDYSSYHMVDYDENTGGILNKQTVQGAFDESAWARGQSWGLYGYTVMFRETKQERYLLQAQYIANYIINRLPADYIPYWDYDVAQNSLSPKDASAGAIAASALFELSQFVPDSLSKRYFAIAEKILFSLASNAYLASYGENGNFILKHSTGHKPNNSEINVPLIYADYYYIEALMRYNQLSNGPQTGLQSVKKNEFSIFPNPNNGNFDISFNEMRGNCNIKIFNILGSKIFERNLINPLENKTESIALGHITSGNYLIQLADNQNVVTRNFIVK